jgi:NitT/TauT family transport system ATP-binding protein
MTDSVIEIRDVHKRFITRKANFLAIHSVNLSIKRNEFVAIVGPSGCGKSTLLNLIAGLDYPTRGKVLYEGKPVTEINTDLGYITQNDTVLPWRTVEENVGISLEIRKIPKALKDEKVRSYIQMAGLAGFEKFYPSQLSGGMRKRVGLIRTLIYDPGAILMDEPFGALDAQLKLVMQNELLKIFDETRKTILFVTHDLGEAISLADRVAVFSGRPGTIKKIKEVLIPRPRDIFKIRFSKRFGDLYEELWESLKEEVSKGESL